MLPIQKAVFLVFLALGCQISLGGQEAWKGSIKIENGVTVVKNPTEPIFGGDVIDLIEDYVITSAGKYGHYHLQRPSWLLSDEKCHLYVLDWKDNNIKVFDDRGQYILSIGKKGIGPGELDGPSGMDLFHDEIGIFSAQRQLSFFGTDGKFRRMLHADCSLAGMRFDSGGNVYAFTDVLEADRARYELRKFDPGLKFIKAIASYERAFVICCFIEGAHFVVTNDNHVIYGHAKDYELKVFDDEGKLIRRILKDHRPAKIPSDEIESLKRRHKSLPPEYYVWPKYYPPFSGFWIDEEGRIIVNTQYHLTGDNEGVFDVFSPEGKFLTTIKMKYLHTYLWANKRLYAVDEDEDGFPIIRVFRVNWKAGLALGDADHWRSYPATTRRPLARAGTGRIEAGAGIVK